MQLVMKPDYKYSRVRLLHSVSDSYHGLERWNENTYPLLFVMGLSGAGKTTICTALSVQYKCPYISLDALRFYDSASPESRQAVDEFLLLYPHIAASVTTHWARQDFFHSNERAYAKYTRLFIAFLRDRAAQEQQRYIVEGIQLFVRQPKETLLNQPKIILGTGGLKCFYRAAKRTYPKMHFRFFPDLICRFFRYYVIQLIRLNYYIDFWERKEFIFQITRTDSQ